jgi:hypothetical protein
MLQKQVNWRWGWVWGRRCPLPPPLGRRLRVQKASFDPQDPALGSREGRGSRRRKLGQCSLLPLLVKLLVGGGRDLTLSTVFHFQNSIIRFS